MSLSLHGVDHSIVYASNDDLAQRQQAAEACIVRFAVNLFYDPSSVLALVECLMREHTPPLLAREKAGVVTLASPGGAWIASLVRRLVVGPRSFTLAGVSNVALTPATTSEEDRRWLHWFNFFAEDGCDATMAVNVPFLVHAGLGTVVTSLYDVYTRSADIWDTRAPGCALSEHLFLHCRYTSTIDFLFPRSYFVAEVYRNFVHALVTRLPVHLHATAGVEQLTEAARAIESMYLYTRNGCVISPFDAEFFANLFHVLVNDSKHSLVLVESRLNTLCENMAQEARKLYAQVRDGSYGMSAHAFLPEEATELVTNRQECAPLSEYFNIRLFQTM